MLISDLAKINISVVSGSLMGDSPIATASRMSAASGRKIIVSNKILNASVNNLASLHDGYIGQISDVMNTKIISWQGASGRSSFSTSRVGAVTPNDAGISEVGQIATTAHLNDFEYFDEYIDSAAKEFIAVAVYDSLDYVEESRSDEILKQILNSRPESFLRAVNEIVTRTYSRPKILAVLLKSLGGIGWSVNFKDILVTLTGACSHKDFRVNEAALHVFERWKLKSSLEFLENTAMRHPQLEIYRKSIINVIYKKGR